MFRVSPFKWKTFLSHTTSKLIHIRTKKDHKSDKVLLQNTIEFSRLELETVD